MSVFVPCAAAFDPLADDLLEMFAQLGARAGAPHAGARMRWAWSVVTLRADEAGLVAHEPDFDGDAMAGTRPAMDATFRTVRAQWDFCGQAGVDPVDCWFDSLVLIGPDALGAPSQRLVRDQPAEICDSGWYVADADERVATDDPGAISTLRCFELVQRLPAALPALALPPNVPVMIERGQLRLGTGPT